MDEVFSEILGTPGVQGLFVFSPPDKVLVSTLGGRLDGPGLISSGKLLQRIHAATRMNIADVSELLLFYEEALLLVKEISDKVFLVIMAEGSANPYLITMSIGMSLDDLKAWIQGQHAATRVAPATPVAPAPPAAPVPPAHRPEPEVKPAPVAPKPTPEELMESGPLADTLSEMQSALARVMGPMASIIFSEAQTQWISATNPSEATLGELVKILTREIRDPERIKRFRDMVSPLLRMRR
jgi:hypothetical protein